MPGGCESFLAKIDLVRFRDQVRERFRDFEYITTREAMTHETMLSG
jgi:hypothetical protein